MSLLRVELNVLCVTVFGCVVVELRLLGHRRRSVRGVFHYVDISVCCELLAVVLQVGHDTGSTDVLMIFDQVSWWTKLVFRFRRLVR